MITTARPRHLQDINRIYNEAVRDGFRTAHTEPISLEKREKWLDNHNENRFPVFVYLDDQKLKGWIAISPYRKGRQALSEVAVTSYYVDYEYHGMGIASLLMDHAIGFCKNSDFRILTAILIDGNTPSIKLLKKFKFQECGRIPDAIHYKGAFRDHLYYCRSVK